VAVRQLLLIPFEILAQQVQFCELPVQGS
jgi:hypothetical protein